MSDTPLGLKEAQEKRPLFKDVPLEDMTLRIRRLPLSEKLEVLRMLADAQGDDGVIADDDEAVVVWTSIIAKCLANTEGEPEFDCEEGVAFVASLSTRELLTLQGEITLLNGLGATVRVAEIDAAKND